MNPHTRLPLFAPLLSLGVVLGLTFIGQVWGVAVWLVWWLVWFWRWRNPKAPDVLEARLGQEVSPHLLSAMTQVSQLLLNPYQERRVDRVLQVLAQHLTAERGFVIGYIDPPRWQVYHHWSALGQVPWDRWLPLRGESPEAGLFDPHQLKKLQLGQPVDLYPTQLLPTEQANRRALGLASVIAVPVFVEGRWWGVLGLASTQTGRRWQESEVMLLQTAANSLAGAIELSQSEIARLRGEVDYQQLYMQVEQNRHELLQVNQLLQGVSQATRGLVGSNHEQSLQTFSERLGVFAKADRAYIYQFKAQQAVCYSEWNAEGIPPVHRDAHQALWSPEWLQSLQQGQPVVLRLASLSPEHQRYLAKSQTKALIGVPLRIEGQPWGFIGLDNCQEERLWIEGDVRTLQTAANALSEFLGRLQAQQNLELRNQLLQGMAQATQLLVSANELSVLGRVLEHLGPAANVDRCYIYQYHEGTTPQSWLHSELYEWCAPEVEPSLRQMQNLPSNPERRKQFETDGFFIWNLEDLALTLIQTDAAQIARTGVNMALFKGGVLWGFIGFENVYSPRIWQRSDIQTLQTVANAIGEFLLRLESKEALESYNRLLEGLATGSQGLLSADGPEAIWDFVELVGTTLESDRCHVYQYHPHPETGKLAISGRYGWSKPQYSAAWEDVRNGSPYLPWYESLSTGQPLVVYQDQFPRYLQPWFAERSTYSFLSVALLQEGVLWGSLIIEDCSGQKAWGETEIRTIEAAASSLSNFLSRQRGKTDLERQNRFFLAVAETAQGLLVGETDAAIQEALKGMAQALGAGGAYIEQLIVDESSGEERLTMLFYWASSDSGMQTQGGWSDYTLRKPYEPFLEVMRRNEALLLSLADVPADRRDYLLQQGIGAFLNVPIFVRGNLWGIFGFDFGLAYAERLRLSPGDIEAARTAAAAFASVLQKRAFEVGLHRSEARFQAMMEALPTGIVRVNANGVAFYANLGFQKASGLSPAQVLGHSIYEWTPPEAVPLLKERFEQVIRHRRNTPAFKMPYRHPDGLLRTVEIGVVPLIEDDQNSALLLFRDVSDKAMAAKDLQSSNPLFFAGTEAIQALLPYGSNDPMAKAHGLLPEDDAE